MARVGRKNDDAVMLKLAGGSTVHEAARQTGVSERTIYRRLADPDTRRRLTDLRGDMVQRALGLMADGMADAACTLRALLTADKESVRLGAARSILEVGNRLRESVDVEQLMADLTKRMDETQVANAVDARFGA